MSDLTPEQEDYLRRQYELWFEELRAADPSPSRAMRKVAGDALAAGIAASPLAQFRAQANARTDDRDAPERPRGRSSRPCGVEIAEKSTDDGQKSPE